MLPKLTNPPLGPTILRIGLSSMLDTIKLWHTDHVFLQACNSANTSFGYTHTHTRAPTHTRAHTHHAIFLQIHLFHRSMYIADTHSAHSSLTAPRKFPGGDSTSILCLWQKQQKLHIVQQPQPHLKGRTMCTTSLFWSSLNTIVKLRMRPCRRRPRVLESGSKGKHTSHCASSYLLHCASHRQTEKTHLPLPTKTIYLQSYSQ